MNSYNGKWDFVKSKQLKHGDLYTILESGYLELYEGAVYGRLPDFNWHGGHSGRRLTDDYATRLDMIWLEYIHSNPRMFAEGNATISEWCGVLLSEAMEEALRA